VPEIAVAVASHARPIRLRWLLNALSEQTLAPDRWELVVAHDGGAASETAQLLRERGVRHVTFDGSLGPARLRNAAWRATDAPFVAFTDDDCRPPADWLANALAAARGDAIVQGATRPDPDEAALLRAPHPRTVVIDPPTPQAQTCNIVYPRAVLERAGGFDECGLPLTAGEDTDLAWRADVPVVGAPSVVTYHCVEVMPLWRRAAFTWRWRQLPALVKRHPGLREHMTLRIFWKRRHAWFLLALLTRHPSAIAAYALEVLPSYGRSKRGLVRAIAEVPGQAAIDAVEVAAMVAGSARHRTLFL
jgi:GT2 family glycosyltransferase